MAYKRKYFFKYSSKSFFRKSCLISGNCRSVSSFFKLSRHKIKLYISKGFLSGLRKASF
jgi:ribosomal protein S14